MVVFLIWLLMIVLFICCGLKIEESERPFNANHETKTEYFVKLLLTFLAFALFWGFISFSLEVGGFFIYLGLALVIAIYIMWLAFLCVKWDELKKESEEKKYKELREKFLKN